MTFSWRDVAERVRSWPETLMTVPSPWYAPAIADFAKGVEVLAYDATLSNSGWACIERKDSLIIVHGHGTLKVKTALTGFQATYAKASEMAALIQLAWHDQKNVYGSRRNMWTPLITAFELPAVHGWRTESSLIATWIIYHMDEGRALPVSANHASKVLAGNPRHDKNEIKLAVARYVPEVLNRGWDEHQRDALAIALTTLYDMQLEASRRINVP